MTLSASPDRTAGVDQPTDAAEPRISAPASFALTPAMAVINFAFVAATLGFSSVLLPNQLTLIDEVNKVANLALVTSVSMISTIVLTPLIGAISDRTRSRWGRRAPWMALGGLLLVASFTGLAFAQSVVLILALATLMQIGAATFSAPVAAIIADRYAVEKRGLVSGFIGLGLNVGYAFGVLIAATLAFNLQLAYVTFAIGVAVILLGFLLVARDTSSKSMSLEPFSFKTFVVSFWINPIKYPDFAWAFVARFLYILAYFVVFSYLFFVLTDFVGLDLDGAINAISIVGIIALPPAVIGGYLVGWISDKFGRRKAMLYLACAITAAGYLAQILWPTIEGVYAMTIITSLAFGMYLASDAVVMTQVLPNLEGAAAKDLGILNLATLIGQALSAVIAALVITNLGGYTGLFVAGIVIAVLGGLAVIPIRGVK